MPHTASTRSLQLWDKESHDGSLPIPREFVIRKAIPDERGVDNNIAGEVKTVTFIKQRAREMPQSDMHELVAECKIQAAVAEFFQPVRVKVDATPIC